jgi:CheY-like chemotaxis protein
MYFDDMSLFPYVDSIPNRNILARLLNNQGLECDKVEDGQQAVKLVAQDIDKYGLIFMDRVMPNMVSFSTELNNDFISYLLLLV